MNNDHSEPFRKVPNNAETFGNVPKPSEAFRSIPNTSERKQSHTLTVREAARMFEDAGVARTERSVINWCNPNKDSISRLDCFYDANEHKYFITPQSVELAIKEEQAKASVERGQAPSEPFRKAPGGPSSETRNTTGNSETQSAEEERTLRAKVRRLTVEGEVNKRYIEKLESEREKYIEQMMAQSRQIGVLETKLLQLQAPKSHTPLTTDNPHAPHEAEYTEARPVTGLTP